MSQDYESSREYLVKKYFECSLDQLCAGNINNGIFSSSALVELDAEEEAERVARRMAFVEELHKLLGTTKFFTDRQRQVLLLLLGWHNDRYVGTRNISEISKILHIAQPVVFNHYKLIIKKLKRHFEKKKML